MAYFILKQCQQVVSYELQSGTTQKKSWSKDDHFLTFFLCFSWSAAVGTDLGGMKTLSHILGKEDELNVFIRELLVLKEFILQHFTECSFLFSWPPHHQTWVSLEVNKLFSKLSNTRPLRTREIWEAGIGDRPSIQIQTRSRANEGCCLETAVQWPL